MIKRASIIHSGFTLPSVSEKLTLRNLHTRLLYSEPSVLLYNSNCKCHGNAWSAYKSCHRMHHNENLYQYWNCFHTLSLFLAHKRLLSVCFRGCVFLFKCIMHTCYLPSNGLQEIPRRFILCSSFCVSFSLSLCWCSPNWSRTYQLVLSLLFSLWAEIGRHPVHIAFQQSSSRCFSHFNNCNTSLMYFF